MSTIEQCPFCVMQRFPDHKDAIRHLFREDETFQAICEDYHECTQALRYWRQSASGEAPARIEEYRDLMENLEEEIAFYLKKVK